MLVAAVVIWVRGHEMTGTALGDPIEVGAQEKIYGKDEGVINRWPNASAQVAAKRCMNSVARTWFGLVSEVALDLRGPSLEDIPTLYCNR